METVDTEWDEEADSELRIWHQMVRSNRCRESTRESLSGRRSTVRVPAINDSDISTPSVENGSLLSSRNSSVRIPAINASDISTQSVEKDTETGALK